MHLKLMNQQKVTHWFLTLSIFFLYRSIKINTRASQKFCNILVAWGTIRKLRMLYRSQESDEPHWTVKCLPDTLPVILARFASITLNRALKYTILGRPDLAWSSRCLQPEQNLLNNLVPLQLYFHLSHKKCFFFYFFHCVALGSCSNL